MTELLEVIGADGEPHDLDECITRGVSDLAGLFAVPEKRGTNLVVPGEHGRMHVVSKKYDANILVLNLWVRGALPDGSLPEGGDGQQQFVENLRQLLGWFSADEVVTLRYTVDGAAREITGEVLDGISPQLDGYGRYRSARVRVVLECAHPFWADVEPVEETVSLENGETAALEEFAGATAPMEDLQLVFEEQNNPRLSQVSTGIFVKLNRVIGSGQTITVDTAAWEVYGSSGVAGGLYEDLEYGGRQTNRWFALFPEPGGGAPVVQLQHTGGGEASVTVTGKRKYKIA